MVHLPVILDALVLMSTVLIFKIQISRFSSFVNAEVAQGHIAEACNYFREGINEFNDIPARVSIFVEALYTLVIENLVPVGGFVIENTKCRYSQNILYEVGSPSIWMIPQTYILRFCGHLRSGSVNGLKQPMLTHNRHKH
jgi:hypothetical protein